jgi:hypothetical protein
MTVHRMPSIQRSRVCLVDALDPSAQIGIRSAHKQVDVVRHEAKRQDTPAAFEHLAREEAQVSVAILLVIEQETAGWRSRSHVVETAGEFDAWMSWHAVTRPAGSALAPD